MKTLTPAHSAGHLLNRSRRHSRFVSRVAALFVLLCVMFLPVREVFAQTVTIDGPPGPQLATLTPRFVVRARGFQASDGPLRYSVFITRNSTGDGPFIEILTATTSDTIANFIVTRLLPDTAMVYWKARVVTQNNSTIESTISTVRRVPRWLTLLEPNSPDGNQFETRKPTFRWESAAIDAEYGSWIYSVEILDARTGAAEQTKVGITGTTYIPDIDLQANRGYKWRLTAAVTPTGEVVVRENLGTLFIKDPALPTTTLLYQNFPNPFPTPRSFTTCFWFDVANGGARVSLDILDLRGTLVRTILPPTQLEGGVYGRGPVGAASNCDNRFVWNGTSSSGLTVPGGIYLARFSGTGVRTQYRKIVFNGR